MSWCFAKVNNRLAEIYFEKKRGKPKIFAHCYVKEFEYKTKQELGWITKDTKRVNLIYRNGKYTQKSKVS